MEDDPIEWMLSVLIIMVLLGASFYGVFYCIFRLFKNAVLKAYEFNVTLRNE